MSAVAHHLRNHAFTELFNELGWEYDRAPSFEVNTKGRKLSFTHIAEKRGLRVIVCRTVRAVLSNRGLLRAFQRHVARVSHEHILIYTCDEPRKQVWQWAVRFDDGRKVRHREHPFFSDRPPPELLARLDGLRVTLTEEEAVTLVDARERVCRALDVVAEQQLFARKPLFAERSDELARAVQRGEEGALHRFILFHRPLARKIAKRLQRWFELPVEDSEQIAFLGLIHAAERFRPEKGYQFSTYASWWIKQACQREGPDAALLIRVPLHAFWDFFRFDYELERVEAAGGPVAVRARLHEMERADRKVARQYHGYRRARTIETLSDPALLREAKRIRDPIRTPLDECIRAEEIASVAVQLSHLDPRAAEILRARNGIGCEVQTLRAIAVRLGLTHERVRQIESSAEQELRDLSGCDDPQE